MKEKFIDRLILVKAKFGLTYKKLAEILSISDDVAGNYLSGRTPMPLDKMAEMCAYLRIDPDWLLIGKGINPLEDGIIYEPSTPYPKAHGSRATFNPQPDHHAQIRNLLAGITDGFQEGEYRVYDVEGTSMEPTLHPGDKLLCRKEDISQIVDTRIYVIVTTRPDLVDYRQSGTWVKRLQHRKERGYINFRSDNMDTAEPYPTFRLKINEIKEIWHPVLRITWHMADPNRDIYDRLDELESRIEMLEEDRE